MANRQSIAPGGGAGLKLARGDGRPRSLAFEAG
jgi:hypothetical protein